MAQTRLMEGGFIGGAFELIEVTLAGLTEVTVTAKMKNIKGVAGWMWAETPDNATYQVYTSTAASGNTIGITCTHATTKKVHLLLIGTP